MMWFEYPEGLERDAHRLLQRVVNTDSERRVAEALLARLDAVQLTKAARDVLSERRRQVQVEGWSPEHDDAHRAGELAGAAAAYCASAIKPTLFGRVLGKAFAVPPLWPHSWDLAAWWKPKDPRADLVRAGALILAEIERIDRKPNATVRDAGEQ